MKSLLNEMIPNIALVGRVRQKCLPLRHGAAKVLMNIRKEYTIILVHDTHLFHLQLRSVVDRFHRLMSQ